MVSMNGFTFLFSVHKITTINFEFNYSANKFISLFCSCDISHGRGFETQADGSCGKHPLYVALSVLSFLKRFRMEQAGRCELVRISE